MAAKQNVAVVTDSATALPREVASKHGLLIAPMEVTIGNQTFLDGPGGSLDGFYDLLRSAERLPTTSAPKPDRWLACIKQAAARADSVLCVTLAAHLSAAYDSARVAAELAEEEIPDTNVRVMDSRAAAGSQALIALEAARHASLGAGIAEVETAANMVVGRVKLVAFLETLEYIWKGGRVPRIAVWASTLFNIKPVMEMSSGRVNVLARPRSRRRAEQRLLVEMDRDLDGRRAHVVVMHADAAGEAEALLETARARYNCAELLLTQFHPFMGAHTGPGLVATAYWAEP